MAVRVRPTFCGLFEATQPKDLNQNLQIVHYIAGVGTRWDERMRGGGFGNFVGQHFWARGYFVSTVGRDEAAIRDYIKSQEKEDQRLDQLNLWR